MSNHNLGAKCLLLGVLVVLLGAIYSQPGLAASRAPHHPPDLGQRYEAQSAGARATLTPAPTAGPHRPSLCERRPAGSAVPAGCMKQSADIYLRLSTNPGGATTPGQLVTYQLVARNSGRGDAAGVRITLPIAPDVQKPLDAAFSDSGAWVSAILKDAVELRLERLKRDQTITATLWLRTSADVQIGRDLTTRARLRWSGRSSGNTRLSNRAPLVVAQRAEERRPVALAIDPAAGTPAATFVIAYDGFASNEGVSLWYHRPDGSSVGLGEVRADAQGRIGYRLAASALGEGRYTVVAAGGYSQVSAVGTFTVIRPQPTPPPAP